MLKMSLPVALLAAAALVGASHAAGNLYKYKNDKGVMVIESSIPPEYANRGYQVISPAGHVIQTVAPAAPQEEQEAAARKRQEDAVMGRRDVELRKLYSSPEDAVRLRNRQMDSVLINVDFAKGQLLQLTNKRKLELEQAARMERKGQKVSQAMRDSIERLNRQVAEKEAQIKGYEADREKIRTDFSPIIQRLNTIYPDKALPNEVGAPAAAPAPATSAAPAAPAAKPAAAKP